MTTTHHVVLGILRRGAEIALIQQHRDGPGMMWSVPGGLVEAGELLTEAVVREVREETGLKVLRVERLAYMSQIDFPRQQHQTMAFAFEMAAWEGTFQPEDPDGEVLIAEWVPIEEALQRVQSIGWRGMRDPLIAYLRGDAPAGSTWFFRCEDGTEQKLVTRLG